MYAIVGLLVVSYTSKQLLMQLSLDLTWLTYLINCVAILCVRFYWARGFLRWRSFWWYKFCWSIPCTTPYSIGIRCMTLWLVNGMHTLLIAIEALSIMPQYGQWFSGYALRAFGHHFDTIFYYFGLRFCSLYKGYFVEFFLEFSCLALCLIYYLSLSIFI